MKLSITGIVIATCLLATSVLAEKPEPEPASQEYTFVGFTTTAYFRGTDASYTNFTHVCKSEFGSTAKVATSKEIKTYIDSHGALPGSVVGYGWVHPEIVASGEFPWDFSSAKATACYTGGDSGLTFSDVGQFIPFSCSSLGTPAVACSIIQ